MRQCRKSSGPLDLPPSSAGRSPQHEAEHGVEAELEGAVRAPAAGRLRGERGEPVTAPADEVAAAPIRLTMVDGAVTHRAG
jgi:hypothetical protein